MLIADDNSDMRHYLVRLLQRDYEVQVVAIGQEAIQSAQRHPPHPVLSDMKTFSVDSPVRILITFLFGSLVTATRVVPNLPWPGKNHAIALGDDQAYVGSSRNAS